MSDWTMRAIERMKTAATGADAEAVITSDDRRAHYCEGTAHGLREAIRMLEEERAATTTPAETNAVRAFAAEVRGHYDAGRAAHEAGDANRCTVETAYVIALVPKLLKVTEALLDSMVAPDADPLSVAMARAPEVEWLTPEQRAESDKALERLHSGRARLIRDADRVAVLATLPTDTDRCLSTVPSDLPGPNVPRSLIGERCELDAHGHGSHRATKGDEWIVWKDGQVVDSSVYRAWGPR